MKRTRTVAPLVNFGIVVVFLLSSACSARGEASLLSAPTPTITPTPTSTPTAIPSPTMSQEEIELNQKIQDFLYESGDFTDEKIDNRSLIYRHSKLDFGWVGGNGSTISLQGWFFDYTRVNDYLILAVGFDGEEGQKHVKPVAIPISYFENGNQAASFSFEELRDWNMSTHHKLVWESSIDGILFRLNTVKGNPIILSFYNNMANGTIEEAVKFFGEGCELYFTELWDTEDLANRLVSDVSVSNNESLLIRAPAEFEFNAENIPEIQNVIDLKNVDISEVPRAFQISSNLR